MNTLVIEETLSTWVPPTIALLLLGIAVMLDALGMVSEQGAALVAVVSLLILGAFAVLGPLLRDRTPSGSLPTATATGAGLRQVFGLAFVGGIVAACLRAGS